MSNTHLPTQLKIKHSSRGFTLIELIVVVSVVAILATAALDKLFWYQGQAEKASMEYTASMIKSGLWMSAASLMMANRGTEIPALAQQNPINLLAQKPENYLGELDSNNTTLLKGGNWFYDPSKHQVGYVINQRRDFTPAITDDYTVRYGMKVLYSEIELASGKKAPYITGVTLVPLTKYVWQ
ncbi:hypothetical protein GALL_169430 [mine drainage metagenome]|uniref:Prepilin-type N-terminal cleavage/methylation domain-containing protein n=1 Tax=mine drainage metagenome TaxID=410659 RepID=A0A1J5RZ39_9ZZZZ